MPSATRASRPPAVTDRCTSARTSWSATTQTVPGLTAVAVACWRAVTVRSPVRVSGLPGATVARVETADEISAAVAPVAVAVSRLSAVRLSDRAPVSPASVPSRASVRASTTATASRSATTWVRFWECAATARSPPASCTWVPAARPASVVVATRTTASPVALTRACTTACAARATSPAVTVVSPVRAAEVTAVRLGARFSPPSCSPTSLVASRLRLPGVVTVLSARVAVAMLVAWLPVVATEASAISATEPAVICELVTETTALACESPLAVAVRLTSPAKRVALRIETSASVAAGLVATAARATVPVVVMVALSAITCWAVSSRFAPVSPRSISPVTTMVEPTTSMRAANCGATIFRMASRLFTSTE